MLSSSAIRCGLCEEMFSRSVRLPYEVPCSHIFCSVCLDTLYNQHGEIGCAMCRQNFGSDVKAATRARPDILETIEKSQRSIQQKGRFPLSPARHSSPRDSFFRLTPDNSFSKRPVAQTAPRFSLPRSKSPRGRPSFFASSTSRAPISSRQTLRFESPSTSPLRLSSSEKRPPFFSSGRATFSNTRSTKFPSSPRGSPLNRELSKFEPLGFQRKESFSQRRGDEGLKSRSKSPASTLEYEELKRFKEMHPKVYCAYPSCEAKRASFLGEQAPFCSKECEVNFYGPNPESTWNHIYSESVGAKKVWGSRVTSPLRTSILLGRTSTPQRGVKTFSGSQQREDDPKCDNQECNNTVSGEHEIDEYSFCSNRCYRSYLVMKEISS